MKEINLSFLCVRVNQERDGIFMENNKDWKELEEWNAKNEAKNKFYENSELKKTRDINAKKFSKMANIFSFTVITPIMIITLVLTIIILLFLVVFFHHLKVDTETEILQQLKNEYSRDFVIVEENIISDKLKIYKISPKNNKNIVFKAVQSNFKQHNDYKEYLIKDAIQAYLNTLNGTNIKVADSTTLSNNQQYYKLKYGINISTYSELPDAVKEIYNCNDYISKKLKKEFKNINFYFNGYLSLNNWTTEISNNIYNKSLDTYIYEAQHSYIEYLKSNNLTYSDISDL